MKNDQQDCLFPKNEVREPFKFYRIDLFVFTRLQAKVHIFRNADKQIQGASEMSSEIWKKAGVPVLFRDSRVGPIMKVAVLIFMKHPVIEWRCLMPFDNFCYGSSDHVDAQLHTADYKKSFS